MSRRRPRRSPPTRRLRLRPRPPQLPLRRLRGPRPPQTARPPYWRPRYRWRRPPPFPRPRCLPQVEGEEGEPQSPPGWLRSPRGAPRIAREGESDADGCLLLHDGEAVRLLDDDVDLGHVVARDDDEV